MELKEMIKVMQHYENGGEVEFKKKDEDDTKWRIPFPTWNWDDFKYRIKEQKQKVTIEKWLIEENNIKFVVETFDVDSLLKSFPTAKKLKLIETYEVEL